MSELVNRRLQESNKESPIDLNRTSATYKSPKVEKDSETVNSKKVWDGSCCIAEEVYNSAISDKSSFKFKPDPSKSGKEAPPSVSVLSLKSETGSDDQSNIKSSRSVASVTGVVESSETPQSEVKSISNQVSSMAMPSLSMAASSSSSEGGIKLTRDHLRDRKMAKKALKRFKQQKMQSEQSKKEKAEKEKLERSQRNSKKKKKKPRPESRQRRSNNNSSKSSASKNEYQSSKKARSSSKKTENK